MLRISVYGEKVGILCAWRSPSVIKMRSSAERRSKRWRRFLEKRRKSLIFQDQDMGARRDAFQ